MPEIQAIAKEVGLDPTLIERAASLVPAGEEGRMARLFGGPDKYQLEYTAAGTISQEGLGRVVDAIRRATGHHGKIEEALGSLEWQTVAEVSQINVTVSPRGELTSVRVTANRAGAGVLTFVFPVVAGLIGIGITGAIIEPSSVAGVIGVIVAPVSAGLLTARTLWSASTKHFRVKFRNLMDAVSRAVDENVQPPQLPADDES